MLLCRMLLVQRPFLLLLLLSLLSLGAWGQSCNGSLGDPVIDQNFGSGANPGAPLAAGITNMTYTAANSPKDGQYTIANSLLAANNIFTTSWWDVPHDHTGNPNGYMMIVNASLQPSIFFNQTANGLCPNTTYYFSAYILNLTLNNAFTANFNHPNILFAVVTPSGQILDTASTGSIPLGNSGTDWKQYGVFFTTPADVSEVVVVMSNKAPGGYGNDFILDDITFRACGPIITEGISSVAGPKNLSLCEGASTTVNFSAQVVGNGTPFYQWQSNIDSAGWLDMAGATSNTINIPFVNAQPGQYQYRMGVANGSAITNAVCRVYSTPMTVYVNPLPVVPAIPSQVLCQGSQLQLQASGGATYTWNGPGIANASQNPLVINNVTPANSGTYTVVAMSDSGCTAVPVSTTVIVYPTIIPTVSSNVGICAGESTQLSASGGTHYLWEPATGLDNDTIPNPTATPSQTTPYKVIISNGGCVDSSKTVMVTVNQNPIANAGSDIYLFQGQSTILQGSAQGDNITGTFWTPATFLSDPTSLTPIATPTHDITYTLTVATSTCGASTSSVFVRVYQKVTIPNAFSPNNDGINDYWDIQALNTYPESITQVFNRYGQQVFQSTGYANPWDGTSNGKALPAGTYYYIIDLKNGQPKLSGWVLIVR